MKNIKITCTGEVPKFISDMIEKYNGLQATKDTLYNLDSDISFIVVDCKEAHGNLSNASKSAWLCDKTSNNAFNVSISWG